jgi:hypothetical protein
MTNFSTESAASRESSKPTRKRKTSSLDPDAEFSLSAKPRKAVKKSKETGTRGPAASSSSSPGKPSLVVKFRVSPAELSKITAGNSSGAGGGSDEEQIQGANLNYGSETFQSSIGQSVSLPLILEFSSQEKG